MSKATPAQKGPFYPIEGARSGRIHVTQVDDNPIEVEVLAQSIVSMSASLKRLTKSGLNRKAIVVLVAHDTKLGHGQIENVLGSLERLAQTYTVK